jgi:hypothetical protein
MTSKADTMCCICAQYYTVKSCKWVVKASRIIIIIMIIILQSMNRDYDNVEPNLDYNPKKANNLSDPESNASNKHRTGHKKWIKN